MTSEAPFPDLDDRAVAALAPGAAPAVIENLRILRDHASILAAAMAGRDEPAAEGDFEP
jgi:hypothetical protein